MQELAMSQQKLKPPPAGWPRISTSLFYEDAASAIDWLVRVFDFEVRLRVDGEGNRIEHSELTYGDGLIMVSTAGGKTGRESPQMGRSPRAVGGANTQALCIVVDDVDAHAAKSRQAGAKIVEGPRTSDYGEEYWSDRAYLVEDLEGHQWWFMQRIRDKATSAP
jgi:uncharacterized glyoxalase superfamily protein PhnB